MVDTISVFIVDDHAVVRQGLRTFLESEKDIDVLGEAGDGKEAVEQIQDLLPDVVLMDLVMPGMNGVEAIRRITEKSPHSRVLVLTSFSDDEKVFESIKAGAMGYQLKDVPPEDLGRAIRSVASGEFHLHPLIARRVLDEFSNMWPKTPPPITSLSSREVDVLTLIARGMSNQEIAFELRISIKTVKTHVSNILSKLHLVDRTQAAVYAVRQGLVPPK